MSPKEIRETIQQLVATDDIELAQALGDAGFAIFPESEDMLAINGLLSLMQGDWSLAVEMLTHLKQMQGNLAPLFTFVMLVRALRCNLDLDKALEIVNEGLKTYPDQLELVAEKLALESMGGFGQSNKLPL
jgi:hypothetical protein